MADAADQCTTTMGKGEAPVVVVKRTTFVLALGSVTVVIASLVAVVAALLVLPAAEVQQSREAFRASLASSRAPAIPVQPCELAVKVNETARVVWPANRRRLVSVLSATVRQGFGFFEGEKLLSTGDGDTHYNFRQDINFFYVSGVNMPSCSLVIDFASGKTTLFISPIDPIWVGRSYTKEQWAQVFNVDEVLDLNTANYNRFFGTTMAGRALYTLAAYQVPTQWKGSVDRTALTTGFRTARLIKTNEEIALLTVVALISSNAHTALMRHAKSLDSEFAAEAVYLHELYSCLTSDTGYAGIFGAGYNSAILHYKDNDDIFARRDALLLADAAGAFGYYTADITRTWPINGVFTSAQRNIYNAVLKAQMAAEDLCRDGATYGSLSSAARASLERSLLELGLVSSNPSNVVSLFMPHGLSHTIGLLVHDEPGLPSVLRTGMAFTIEPGLYFNEAIFTEQAYAQYPNLNRKALEELVRSGFGGVRIEDDYVVGPSACLRLSDAAPRTVEEIEKVMA